MPITTIPFSDRKAGPYTASAGQTEFSFGFPVLAAGDLSVYRERAGVVAQLVLGTHYTVNGVGEQSGGAIVLTSGALEGDIIAIDGTLTQQRATSFVGGKPFRAATIDTDLNRLAIMVQELARQAGRSIRRAAVDERTGSLELPQLSQTMLLGLDETGTLLGLASLDVTGSTVIVDQDGGIAGIGRLTLKEIATPPNPPANSLHIFARDLAGTTRLYLRDSTGAEIEVGRTRRRLTADTNFYVSHSGSDTTGDGSSGNPWATLQHAYDTIASDYDCSGFQPTIRLAASTTPYAGAALVQPLVSGSKAGFFWHIVIRGDTEDAADVIVDGGTEDAIALGALSVRPMITKMTVTSAEASGLSAYDGCVLVFDDVIFDDCDESMLKADRTAKVVNEAGVGFKVIGDASDLFEASTNSVIQIRDGNTVTFTGTPNFSNLVTNLRHGSRLILGSTVAFSGSATGTRLNPTQGSSIFWPGHTMSELPGDAGGTGPEALVSGSSFNDEFGGDIRLLRNGTITNQPNLDLDLSAAEMGEFRIFKLFLTRFIPATDNAIFFIRTRTAGTAIFDDGGSDYAYAQQQLPAVASSTVALSRDETEDAIYLVANVGNGPAEGLDAEITIYDPFNAATHTKIRAVIEAMNTSTQLLSVNLSGKRNAAEAVDGIRLGALGSNISGRYALYGIL